MDKSINDVKIHLVDSDYQQLVSNITSLWHQAKENAINAVNTELLDANWQTGKYIVEFEQGGKVRAEYGKQLLVNLAKDLTLHNGRGFSRSNLSYMRKFYLSFPKCETVSHKLTWSHYFEILKCDEPLEMQFYSLQQDTSCICQNVRNCKSSWINCWKVLNLKYDFLRPDKLIPCSGRFVFIVLSSACRDKEMEY
jgi:hypothetical protein